MLIDRDSVGRMYAVYVKTQAVSALPEGETSMEGERCGLESDG